MSRVQIDELRVKVPAGQTKTIPQFGRSLLVVSAGHESFSLGLDDDPLFPGLPGMQLGPFAEEFRFVVVKNTHASLELELVCWVTPDGSVIVRRLTGNVTTTEAIPETFDDSSADLAITGAAAAVEVLPANTDRKVGWVINPKGNGPIRIGAAPDATHGIQVEGGVAWPWVNKAQCKVYSATSQSVGRADEE